MFGSKRKEIKDLKEEILALKKDVSVKNIKQHDLRNEMNKELDKLKRIFKYSKDGAVTYNIKSVGMTGETHSGYMTCHTYAYHCLVYIYDDKEEYVVDLEEMKNKVGFIIEEITIFTAYEDRVYLNLETLTTKYSFTIDYKTGKYLCKSERYSDKEINERKEKYNA